MKQGRCFLRLILSSTNPFYERMNDSEDHKSQASCVQLPLTRAMIPIMHLTSSPPPTPITPHPCLSSIPIFGSINHSRSPKACILHGPNSAVVVIHYAAALSPMHHHQLSLSTPYNAGKLQHISSPTQPLFMASFDTAEPIAAFPHPPLHLPAQDSQKPYSGRAVAMAGSALHSAIATHVYRRQTHITQTVAFDDVTPDWW